MTFDQKNRPASSLIFSKVAVNKSTNYHFFLWLLKVLDALSNNCYFVAIC